MDDFALEKGDLRARAIRQEGAVSHERGRPAGGADAFGDLPSVARFRIATV
jgi:hypothetical protein